MSLSNRPDGSPMMCAVCHMPLDEHVNLRTGDTRYVHANEIHGIGHKAIPLAIADSGPAVEHCDFCFDIVPKWVIDASDFPTMLVATDDEATQHWSRGAWAACDTCVELVHRQSRKGLIDRAMARPTVPTREENAAAHDFTREGLRRLHAGFFAHMRGQPYRIGEQR